MRFLLDENVHRGLLPFLTDLKHDVKPSPKGLTNGAVLQLAISEKRILITHDTDFAKDQLVEQHPGIILVRIPPRNIQVLKSQAQLLLSQKSSAKVFTDRLFLVFEDHFEDFPFRFKEFPL